MKGMTKDGVKYLPSLIKRGVIMLERGFSGRLIVFCIGISFLGTGLNEILTGPFEAFLNLGVS